MISFQNQGNAQTKLGVFADCQYSPHENSKTRFYKNSKQKLTNCIEHFNTENLNFVVGLGDLIDKDFSSYDTILPILQNSKHKVYQVIGNHDLSVEKEFIEKVPEKLGLKKTYYSITENDWQFIFLNGNEITLLTNQQKVKSEAEKLIDSLTKNEKPNNKTWNGALGKKQIIWLEKQLKKAEKNQMKVAIFCHYPVYPLEAHCLWDYDKVLATIEKYSCVKLWMNGHNHGGNYGKHSGIYFVNLKGMVDTENENAYSLVTFFDKRVEIEGFGREETRILEF